MWRFVSRPSQSFSTLNRVERIGTSIVHLCPCHFSSFSTLNRVERIGTEAGRVNFCDVNGFSTLNRVERIGTLQPPSLRGRVVEVSVPSIGSNALEHRYRNDTRLRELMFQYPQSGRTHWNDTLRSTGTHWLGVSVPSIGSNALELLFADCWDWASEMFQYPQSGRTHWNQFSLFPLMSRTSSFSTLNRVERIGTAQIWPVQFD